MVQGTLKEARSLSRKGSTISAFEILSNLPTNELRIFLVKSSKSSTNGNDIFRDLVEQVLANRVVPEQIPSELLGNKKPGIVEKIVRGFSEGITAAILKHGPK